jgi:hypothetical protein
VLTDSKLVQKFEKENQKLLPQKERQQVVKENKDEKAEKLVIGVR